MDPLKFDNGIYPAIPGTPIHLGDYGYWEEMQWCYVGNIQNISNLKREFTIESSKTPEFMEDYRGVEFNNALNASCDNPVIENGASITFQHRGSLYFRGLLDNEQRFVSIEGEIKPFLLKLSEIGLWESRYWLAYSIISAKDFISVRSKKSGVTAKISVNNEIDTITDSKVNFKLNCNTEEISIESVRSTSDTDVRYAGARFLSLERKHLFTKKMNIIYNSSSGIDYINDLSEPI